MDDNNEYLLRWYRQAPDSVSLFTKVDYHVFCQNSELLLFKATIRPTKNNDGKYLLQVHLPSGRQEICPTLEAAKYQADLFYLGAMWWLRNYIEKLITEGDQKYHGKF